MGVSVRTITGEGDWVLYQNVGVKPGTTAKHEFPSACQAYWVRLVPSTNTQAAARFEYR